MADERGRMRNGSGFAEARVAEHTPGFRIPPQAIEVEKHVIGAVFLDSEAVGSALESLMPEDFYLEKHQVIFEAVMMQFEKNLPIDLLTISESLKKSLKYDLAGGNEYLMEISSEVVSSANVEEHCQI